MITEVRFFLEIFIIIIISSLVFFKKITLLQAHAFLIPFYGINYDIGVRVTLSQLFLFLLNLHVLLFFIIKPNKELFKGLNFTVGLFLFYAFFSAFLLSTFAIEFIQTKHESFLRNEGRYISQIINWSNAFGIFIVAYNSLKNAAEVIDVLKYLFYGILTVSFIGFIQEVLFITLGVDILPLVTEDGPKFTAVFSDFGIPMIRICSLAGEPKSLGMFALIGIILLKIGNNLNVIFFKYYYFALILLLIVLILSLSTSAFLSLPLLWFLAEVMLRYFNILPKITIGKLFSWVLIIFFIFKFYEPLSNLIGSRVIERDKLEDWDAVVLAALKDNPIYLIFGTGMGNIHNIAAPYAEIMGFYYLEGSVFVGKSGYLRILSETGIFGFILFLLFNGAIFYNSINYYLKVRSKTLILFLFTSVLLFVYYLARSYVGEAYLLVLALTNTYVKKQFK
ncbi:MAG: O-antigen ligase family protein [Bacteroidales bacterium]|nr:O-antigen ligase family protein [Bacteroidales bacterium]